jgi:hypothetical protein
MKHDRFASAWWKEETEKVWMESINDFHLFEA